MNSVLRLIMLLAFLLASVASFGNGGAYASPVKTDVSGKVLGVCTNEGLLGVSIALKCTTRGTKGLCREAFQAVVREETAAIKKPMIKGFLNSGGSIFADSHII